MLIAHWPLNGGIEDISGNGHHLTNYGATESDSGKIGKCYSFDGVGDKMQTPTIFDSVKYVKNEFSVAFWVYPTTDGFITNPQSAGVDQHVRYYSSSQTIAVSLTEFADVNGIGIVTPNGSVPPNQWTHFGFSLDDDYLRMYVNGSLVIDYTKPHPCAPWNMHWTIGARGNNTYWFCGKLNDFRIYDHILSDKEIKEISKAKILHYDFNDIQDYATNEALDDIHISSGRFGISYDFIEIDEDGWKKYAISGTANNPTSYPYTFSIGGVVMNTDIPVSYSYDIKTSVPEKFIDNFSPTITNIYYYTYGTKSKTKFGWKCDGTIPKEQTSGAPVVNYPNTIYCFSKTVDGVTFNPETDFLYVRNLMVEYDKLYASEYVKTTRAGVIRDVSGFGHHANLDISNSPRWVPDSRIGVGAYEFFKEKNSQILTDIPVISTSFARDDSEYTISTWIKLKNENPIGDCLLIGGAYYSGFGIAINTGGGIRGYYRNINTQYGTASYPLTDTWTHISVVLDKPNLMMKLYINGNIYSSKIVSHGDFHYERMMFQINSHQQTGGNDFGTNDCFLDDTRLYATALSDDDIKELYESRANLDDHGNLCVNTINTIIENNATKDDWDVNTTHEWVSDTMVNLTKSIKYTGLIINNDLGLELGKLYKLSYKLKKISGTLLNVGGHTSNLTSLGMYVNGEYRGSFHNDHNIMVDDTMEEYQIEYFFKAPTVFGANAIYIQPNRARIDLIECSIYDIRIEATDSNVTDKGNLETPNISEVGITDGMVGYWKFDGNVRDYSSLTRETTNSNIVVNSDHIYGHKDVISRLTIPNTLGGEEEFSFVIKCNLDPTGTSGGNGLLGAYSSEPTIISIYDNGAMKFELSGGGTRVATSNGVFEFSQDNTYIGVFSNITKEFKTYYNGVDATNVVQNNIEGSIGARSGTSGDIKIGTIRDTQEPLNGKIYELKMFNRALTQDEVVLEDKRLRDVSNMEITSDKIYVKNIKEGY